MIIQAIEVEGEKPATERCEEIIVEGSFIRELKHCSSVDFLSPPGGCDVDKAYTGPQLTLNEGKYSITPEFVRSMIEWFKDGKALPRRYVWEIVLGAYNLFAAEESLVKLELEEGMTCDVIGDVHGAWVRHWTLPQPYLHWFQWQANSMIYFTCIP